MAGRQLAWDLALKRLATPRLENLPTIREKRLQWDPNLRGKFTLSSWVGKSGRGHVVSVVPFRMPDLVLDRDTVLLAVRRETSGLSSLLAVASMDDGLSVWRALDRAAAEGANELHIHRLAETVQARTAIAADLVI